MLPARPGPLHRIRQYRRTKRNVAKCSGGETVTAIRPILTLFCRPRLLNSVHVSLNDTRAVTKSTSRYTGRTNEIKITQNNLTYF